MKKKSLILHIGTEKTGTTSIQDFLALNRAQLKQQGILYPESLGQRNHIKLAAYASHKTWQSLSKPLTYGESDHESFSQLLKQKLQEELALQPEGCAIVSNEHLHSRLQDASQINSIKTLLEQFFHPITVLVYFRRQDLMSFSQYSTALKAGFAEAMPFKLAKNPYYYDFFRIYQNWSNAFGRHQIKVRFFAKEHWQNGNLLEDFCLHSGIGPVKTLSVPAWRNEALSFEAELLLKTLNKQASAGLVTLDRASRQKWVNAICQQYPGLPCYPPKQAAIHFYNQFLESNNELEKLLDTGPKPMFNDDFSMYPEEPKMVAWQEKCAWAEQELRQFLKNNSIPNNLCPSP